MASDIKTVSVEIKNSLKVVKYSGMDDVIFHGFKPLSFGLVCHIAIDNWFHDSAKACFRDFWDFRGEGSMFLCYYILQIRGFLQIALLRYTW